MNHRRTSFSATTEGRRVTGPVPTREEERPLSLFPFQNEAGLLAVGHVDGATRRVWDEAVGPLFAWHTDVHLHLSGLTFIDAAGAAAVAVHAHGLPDGRRVVLHRPPPILERLLGLLWPDDPKIEVHHCDPGSVRAS